MPNPLVELVKRLPAGRMLDVGCGTGSDAIWCPGHGWDVTGIDAVSVPLRRARRNAEAAGADVRFPQANIARIAPAQLGSGYTLLQDIGCFAGLSDADRRRAATTMTEVAVPGARLLMFAFGPGGGGRFGPRRIELPEIQSLFPAWNSSSADLPTSSTSRGRCATPRDTGINSRSARRGTTSLPCTRAFSEPGKARRAQSAGGVRERLRASLRAASSNA